ncbi:hypothetical protein PVK06_005829 [Gossypium arboreum]|uniref:Sulfotransferase n=1 Tax=Gossypium arboreum TaxID=29729 RepID=A0ABR0QW30_GOSAR|nr:hypothetical protein PVK06_005829 [Gossypium arboreum]
MEAFLTLAIERELQLHEGYQKTWKNFNGMLPTLPRGKGWWFDKLLQYNCFWLSSYSLRGCLLINDHFKPRPTDIIVSTSPKCGMTWLTALVFAIINRNSYDFTNHPLHKANPFAIINRNSYDFTNHPLHKANPQDLVLCLDG